MTSRYLTGLGLAFLFIGALLTTTVVAGALLAGRPPQMAGVGGVWLAFSIPTLALLAFVVGPVVLFVRHRFGQAFTTARSAALGATAGPVSLFLIWLLFRESNETFAGLLAFWARLPIEFAAGVLPHAVAGAVFAVWLMSAESAGQRHAA